ncbi:transposase, partial [Bacillus thuringiensis]|uniref:transposase n=1 Tax=Bacillus thuringiensis TaxID=1428 RepID=UPI0034594E0E
HLCPLLKPGSVLVLDNARFHRKSEVERIAKIFRLQVLWLPPYSPDKNKIEKVWANLKNFIRRQGRKFKSLQQSIDSYFKT